MPAPERPGGAPGGHRFSWDLHYALPPALVSPASSMRGSSGPWAPPGKYTVRLTAGGRTLTQALVVTRDPRVAATEAELVQQYELARDLQSERVRVALALRQADALRRQMAAHKGKPGAEQALSAFGRAVDRAAGPPILAPGEEFFDTEEISPTSLRRLSTSLSGFQSAVESADAAPTPDAIAGFAARRKQVAEGLARWQEVLATELPKVNQALGGAGLATLKPE